ncbi:response regulator [Flavobacterium sp.]
MKQFDIFYADDDEDDLMLFSEAIEKVVAQSGQKIILHIHRNGENLIEGLKEKKSSNGVAFLDINMPFKSGFELLEEIRKESVISQFPVIMYSTSSNLDNIEKSRQLGADFYVVKPYEFSKLLQIISKFTAIDWNNHQTDKTTFLYK